MKIRKSLIVFIVIVSLAAILEMILAVRVIVKKDINEYGEVIIETLPSHITPIETEKLKNTSIENFYHHIKKFQKYPLFFTTRFESYFVYFKYNNDDYNSLKQAIINSNYYSNTVYYDAQYYHIALNDKDKYDLYFTLTDNYIIVNHITLIGYSDYYNTIILMEIDHKWNFQKTKFDNWDKCFEYYFNEFSFNQ